MLYWSNVALCLALALTSAAVRIYQTFALHEGYECHLPKTNGKKGLCTRSANCPEAECLLSHKEPVKQCYPKRASQVYCCDQERKSARVCKTLREEWDKRPLIYNGLKAKAGEFPHMALLVYYDRRGTRKMCGGSLISNQHILTAAHCFTPFNGTVQDVIRRSTRVYLGSLKFPHDKMKSMPSYLVSEFLIHPEYMGRPYMYNDIALLKLKERVRFNENILPACLNVGDTEKDQKLTATGWGTTTRGGTSNSEYLMKVDVKELNLKACNYILNKDPSFSGTVGKGILPIMICAWDLEGHGDTCLGDSGGPLSYKPLRATLIHNVVGITSFGSNPCASDMPSVYTRVSKYLDWIECHVWPFIVS